MAVAGELPHPQAERRDSLNNHTINEVINQLLVQLTTT